VCFFVNISSVTFHGRYTILLIAFLVTDICEAYHPGPNLWYTYDRALLGRLGDERSVSKRSAVFNKSPSFGRPT